MACTGEDLFAMVQALGAKDALGNLKVGELKDYCKQHGVATTGNKLDMIRGLGKAIMAKFGSEHQEDKGVKRRPSASASSVEPPSRRTRHLVKQRPAAADHTAAGASPARSSPARASPAPVFSAPVFSAPAASAPASSASASAPSVEVTVPQSLDTMTLQELRGRCGDLGLTQAGKKPELVDRIIEGSPQAVASLRREPAAMSMVVTSSVGKEGSRTIEFRAAANETSPDAAASPLHAAASPLHAAASSNAGNEVDAADLWKKAVCSGQERPSGEGTTVPGGSSVQADAAPPTEEGTLTDTPKVRDVFMTACGDMINQPSEATATATTPQAEAEERETEEDVEQGDEEEAPEVAEDGAEEDGEDEAPEVAEEGAEEDGEDEAEANTQPDAAGDAAAEAMEPSAEADTQPDDAAAEAAEPAAEADKGTEEDTATAEDESTQA